MSLQKRNKQYNTINGIVGSDGRVIEDHHRILSEIMQFYSNLYQSRTSTPGPFFNGLPDRGAIDLDLEICEGELSLAECTKALFSMPNDKSPGTDGLSVNFLKKIWHLIGPYVVESLNLAFYTGSLSTEQSRGVFSLILKPGKDSDKLHNYRPICLLNTDHKIAAKALATRLKSVIPSLIGPTQTGFVKGRFIGENIRCILDLINYTSDGDIPGFMFFIDFEKAFDMIEWNFIQESLRYFKIGDDFRKWVSILYNNSNACVVNNGYSTGYFHIGRGVRQGCPLSPYLFILCAEVLALRVLYTRDIRGIRVDAYEYKILQYADDTVFVLDNCIDSLQKIFDILNELKIASGLSINVTKSVLFPLGPLVQNYPFSSYNGISVSIGPISYLGVSFTNNRKDLFELNYPPKLSRLKNSLRSWSVRDMTPIGRNIITKSFGLSQLVFLFLVLPSPPLTFIKEVEKAIYNFIWCDRTEKVKRTTMINNFCEGGLKVTHIESFAKSLKCSWVRRYLNDYESPWKIFFTRALKPHGSDLFFCCNCHKRDTRLPNDNFISQVIEAWCEVSYTTPIGDFGNQIIWNNSHIKVNGKVIFYKKLYEQGILRVMDLFDNHYKPLDFYNFTQTYNRLDISFIHYWGLIKAIPSHWRNALNNAEVSPRANVTNLLQKVMNCVSVSRFVYPILVKNVSAPATSLKKWNNDYFYDDDNWRSIFSMPFKSITEPRLQYFQFKFLHRIVYTNKFLFSLNIVASPFCSFCDSNEETIDHLFWDCSFVSSFILDVEKRLLNKQFFFSKEDIFFGFQGKDYSPFNFVILHLKYFIYCCSRKNEKLDVEAFCYKFDFALKVESYKKKRKIYNDVLKILKKQ